MYIQVELSIKKLKMYNDIKHKTHYSIRVVLRLPILHTLRLHRLAQRSRAV